jgi:hypothetical protein
MGQSPSSLIDAIRNGIITNEDRKQEIKTILSQGIDINQADEEGKVFIFEKYLIFFYLKKKTSTLI